MVQEAKLLYDYIIMVRSGNADPEGAVPCQKEYNNTGKENRIHLTRLVHRLRRQSHWLDPIGRVLRRLYYIENGNENRDELGDC